MFDTGYRMLGAGARGWSKEMIWDGRWEGGSGLGTHVHPWLIHVSVWQNQYSIVRQNKVKIKIKKKEVLEKNEWALYQLNITRAPSVASALRVGWGLPRPLHSSGYGKGNALISILNIWTLTCFLGASHSNVQNLLSSGFLFSNLLPSLWL